MTDLGRPPVVGTESLYAGDKQGFAVGQGSGAITWYGWDGSVLGSCLVPGTLRAVTPSLALCGADGALALAQTGFAAPAATPTPTPAPSQEPEGTPTPAPSGSRRRRPRPPPARNRRRRLRQLPVRNRRRRPPHAPSEEPEETPTPAPSEEPEETPTPAPSEGPEESPAPTPAPPPAGWAQSCRGTRFTCPWGRRWRTCEITLSPWR